MKWKSIGTDDFLERNLFGQNGIQQRKQEYIYNPQISEDELFN